MSRFKELMARDVYRTFLNVKEFAEIHTIGGREMPVLIDNAQSLEIEKRFSQHMDGISAYNQCWYVAAEDFGNVLPVRGAALTMDGQRYKVVEAVQEDYIYVILVDAAEAPGDRQVRRHSRGVRL